MASELVKKAMVFAEKMHSGQTRRNGDSYVTHPKRVADIVRGVGFVSDFRREELICAALLHDTIEDTDATAEQLIDEFGVGVADIVNQVSNNDEQMKRWGKELYLAVKMADPSRTDDYSLIVKLADRLDNVSDFDACDPKWVEKYSLQTEHILNFLEDSRTLGEAHKILIGRIRAKLAG